MSFRELSGEGFEAFGLSLSGVDQPLIRGLVRREVLGDAVLLPQVGDMPLPGALQVQLHAVDELVDEGAVEFPQVAVPGRVDGNQGARPREGGASEGPLLPMGDDTPEYPPLPRDPACKVDVRLLYEGDDTLAVGQDYLHERERPADMPSNQAPGMLSNLTNALLDTVDTSAAAMNGDVHRPACSAP